MKTSIEQMVYLIEEMRKAKIAHPKAKVYYDWEDSEIRITYPLPKDFYPDNPTHI
jgi:hypothetical protein